MDGTKRFLKGIDSVLLIKVATLPKFGNVFSVYKGAKKVMPIVSRLLNELKSQEMLLVK